MTHVYTEEGEPQFHLTDAEAKENGMYFSVTEHQKILAKPALNQWLLGKHLEYAYRNPPRLGEGLQAYIRRIKQEVRNNGGGPAILGTKIHAALESVFRLEQAKQKAKEGDWVEEEIIDDSMKSLDQLDPEMRSYASPVLRWLKDKKFQILEVEAQVVLKEEAVAGTVDLAVLTQSGQKCIIDHKSRKTKGRKIISYQEHPAQCAAYAAAYFGPDAVKNKECYACNTIISTDEKTKDGEARFSVITYTPEEVAFHYETFQMTCELWRRSNDYDPRQTVTSATVSIPPTSEVGGNTTTPSTPMNKGKKANSQASQKPKGGKK